MPTPFYHLSIAEDLCQHPVLNQRVRFLCEQQRGAFLLGHTAPDVQSVSGQTREATHFFDLPLETNLQTAWEMLLKTYPHLANPAHLSPEVAVFICGYLCHLQADWLWVEDIFAPTFGPTADWGTFNRRLYLHNILRSYLDLQVVQQLPGDCGACLKTAQPLGWLPFVEDEALYRWRDFLSDQLYPGAAVQTVEVFAARQGISPAQYYALLSSEQEMDAQVFSRFSPARLAQYRHRVLAENIRLMESYWDASSMRQLTIAATYVPPEQRPTTERQPHLWPCGNASASVCPNPHEAEQSQAIASESVQLMQRPRELGPIARS